MLFDISEKKERRIYSSNYNVSIVRSLYTYIPLRSTEIFFRRGRVPSPRLSFAMQIAQEGRKKISRANLRIQVDSRDKGKKMRRRRGGGSRGSNGEEEG